MATNPPLQLKCAICGKAILPEDFNVSEDGKPVHGEYWLAKVKERKIATKLNLRSEGCAVVSPCAGQ
jgi:hypothetical protein